jgi:hypothetical protein
MFNKSLKLTLTFLLASSIISCSRTKDPYEDLGIRGLGEFTQGNRELKDRKAPRALSMALNKTETFDEGTTKEVYLRVTVLAPGEPVIEVKNMPEGMTFDPETRRLKWRPGQFAGNDPKDPTKKTQIYPIEVWLRSSLDLTEAIQERVSLIVNDVPEKIYIETDKNLSVTEGTTLNHEFTIENSDYPVGPFQVVTSGFPANTKVTAVEGSTNKFNISFTPDHYHVNRIKDKCSWIKGCKAYEAKILVANPANHQEEKAITLKVKDARLLPGIASPVELTQSLDVAFQVTAYDTNKEMSPKIKLVSKKPKFGKIITTPEYNEENNSTVFKVTWSDIPPTHNGESFDFEFKACVTGENIGVHDNCVKSKTKINIELKDRLPPSINRDLWPVGKLQFLNFKEEKTHTVIIRDAEDIKLTPKVEIFPVEMRKYVSWDAQTLKMQFDKAGTFQFMLKATSDYNVETAESFIVEVFREDRAKVLLFADSTKDDEVNFYKKAFERLDIMNPVIQDINTRNISGRDTLIIGTSIIKDNTIQNKMLEGIAQIKNIIVASPLVEDLPEPLLKEIREYYGVSIRGRYNDLSLPTLDKMKFVTRWDFEKPAKKLRLKGIASDESHAPILFSTGVDTRNCQPVMELSDKAREFREEIGIICNRKSGGRLTLLGTEWADLKFENGDENIPFSWLKTMLTTDLQAQKK